MTSPSTIAVIGGTGALGAAIATRLARSGATVLIGSRDTSKAESAAQQLREQTGGSVEGLDNRGAASRAQLVILTVPFASQETTLRDIAAAVSGKIVVDTTVPLVPPKVMRVQLPPEGSAAVRAQRLLGEGVTVVSAFHNVAAHKLAETGAVDCDVLVFGDDRIAREQVIGVVERCGLRGLHGGALVNSAAAEALTSVLIFLNKTYAVDGAGVRITGALTRPHSG